MNNCLVKTYKGQVSAPLAKIGEITFKGRKSTEGQSVKIGTLNALGSRNYVENVTTGEVFTYSGGSDFYLSVSIGDIIRAYSKSYITQIILNDTYLSFDMTLPENSIFPALTRIEDSFGSFLGTYNLISQYQNLTYLKIHSSDIVGSIEGLVESFIERNPSKQETLYVQHKRCYGITFNGEPICTDANIAYKFNIVFSGSGAAVVKDYTTSDVLASYDGTSWTYTNNN